MASIVRNSDLFSGGAAYLATQVMGFNSNASMEAGLMMIGSSMAARQISVRTKVMSNGVVPEESMWAGALGAGLLAYNTGGVPLVPMAQTGAMYAGLDYLGDWAATAMGGDAEIF